MTAIGIDFGTSNSVAAIWGADGAEVLSIDKPLADWENLGFDRVMPSVFAESSEGGSLFGWAAKRAEAGRFEAVKRLFATRQSNIVDDAGSMLAVEECATTLFAQIRAAAAEQGIEASQAVVTVPANSRGLARHRTKICAGMGGFEVLALINEPTAAAMSFAARNPGDQQLLVFDWGGGTLDVTVLRAVEGVFMEQASKGLPTKGGLDFDSRMRKLILESVADTSSWTAEQRRRFELDVELAKIRLSEQEFTVVQLPDGDSRRVTRGMFENAVRSLVEEARRPIQQCLTDIGAGPGSIDSVVMVGGTSKIPLIRSFVGELLEREPETGVDPMTAVGAGAGIAAAILSGELDTHDFFVSTEHALGTIAHDESDRALFSVLIPRNHKLPASRTETYSPATREQDTVRIVVVEGDPEVPIDHPDNVVLKEWTVALPGEPGALDRSFEMTYDYDVNGILFVTVTDSATGKTMLEDDVSFGVTDDKVELVKIRRRAHQRIDDGGVSPDPSASASPSPSPTATASDPEVVKLLQVARVKVIPFIEGDEAESEVRGATDSLEKASPGEVESCKKRLEKALAPFSFLF